MSRALEALESLFRWGLKPQYTRQSLLYLALAFRRRIPQALDLGPLPVPPDIGNTDKKSGIPVSAPPNIDETNEGDGIPALSTETTKPEPPHLLIEPTTSKTIGVLSEYEARLFQQWALHVARDIYPNHPVPPSVLYDRSVNNGIPPDQMFWTDGMEGTGEIEWRDVETESASGSASGSAPGALPKRRKTGTRLGYSHD